MNEKIQEIIRSISVDRIVGTQEYCCIEKEKVRTLLDYITNLQQKVEQLENIRKEAIEFIKENNCIAVNKEYLPKDYEWCCSYDLLNILSKGSASND